MTSLPWIVGGGTLAAYLWSRGRPNGRSSVQTVIPSTIDPPTPTGAMPVAPFLANWVFPVAKWNGRKASVSDGVGSPRPGGKHRGVDIMFVRKKGDPFRAGTPNGSAGHVMPDGIPVLAAGDGVVWSAGLTPNGHAVVIDHGPLKIATFYAHLEKLFVRETDRAKSQQRVKAGEPIGIVRKGVGQDLERDIAIELRVAGPVHLPHAPLARLRRRHPRRRAGRECRTAPSRGAPLPSRSARPCGTP